MNPLGHELPFNQGSYFHLLWKVQNLYQKNECIKLTSILHSTQRQAGDRLKAQDRFTVHYPCLHSEVSFQLGQSSIRMHKTRKDSKTQPVTLKLLANPSVLKSMQNGKRTSVSCKLLVFLNTKGCLRINTSKIEKLKYIKFKRFKQCQGV